MTEREDAQVRADDDPTVDEPSTAGSKSEDEPLGVDVPPRHGCRTERQGWAGAHLHGAVRPRRRPAGRGRPPGRWC